MEVSFPGSCEIISEAFLRQGIPAQSIDTSLASIGTSTKKSYNTAIKKWWFFCKERKIQIFSPSTPQVIEFLQMEFDHGQSHSSLNISRSAISLIVETDIANDARMSRFFKGISKLRPSIPKYNYTWNPKVILDYFSGKPENESLNIKDLSYKLITLLALITGQRIQTLSLIKINNIKISNSEILILIPDPIKNSRRGVSQPLLKLPFYSTNLKICPASTLVHYLDVTASKRGDINELFLSLNRNNCKAVCKQTLSNCVKSVLLDAGIDTGVFTAHSTRHAANSSAKRLGVNVDVIFRTAGWAEGSSTFARFYDRPLVNNTTEFALSILNQ